MIIYFGRGKVEQGGSGYTLVTHFIFEVLLTQGFFLCVLGKQTSRAVGLPKKSF